MEINHSIVERKDWPEYVSDFTYKFGDLLRSQYGNEGFKFAYRIQKNDYGLIITYGVEVFVVSDDMERLSSNTAISNFQDKFPLFKPVLEFLYNHERFLEVSFFNGALRVGLSGNCIQEN